MHGILAPTNPEVPVSLRLLLPALLLPACTGGSKSPPEEPVVEARSFRVLGFNDVYRIEGFPEAGGLARVRGLRTQLEAESPDLLVTGAGDFFYPSLQSRMYGGEQMVDVLNQLDGDPEAVDERLFVTFGNHEFDKGDCEDAANVDARLEQSQFAWLTSNVTFQDCEGGEAPAAPMLQGTRVVEIGGVSVGLFGLTLPLEDEVAYIADISDATEAARAATASLRDQGAEVVIAITHQTVGEDVAMLEALADEGPDLVMGGHEHDAQAAQGAGRWVVKADADARSAEVVTLTEGEAGWDVSHELVQLDESGPAPDPAVTATVDAWLAKHQAAFCAEAGLEDGCLDVALGHTNTVLVGEEVEIRKYETSLGDYVADLAREAYLTQGAQAALINSGSLRLNADIAADSDVTRRHIETLFAFPAGLVLLEVDGATLQQMLDHSISQWAGSGHWLQVSGIRFVHDPVAGTATELSLTTEAGRVPVEAEQTYKIVVGVYNAGGGDGYTMLEDLKPLAEGKDLKELIVEDLQAAEGGISPVTEGRICNTRRAEDCRGDGVK
ncbi:MAG: 5'-nucleotidase C-terminal domain-containing protein [Alphaproteobacteria bacterium]|nr:5'-nucleotidase C-terminal domain-containing protein [Alphaproteobacteria bacterium]